MKRIQKFAWIFLAGFFSLPLFFHTACKKTVTPPMAVITVVDSAQGLPIKDATVRLEHDTLGQASGHVPAVKPNPDTKTTDSRGEVTFELKEEATYFAEVLKPAAMRNGTSSDTAYGIVRFKKNEVNKVTVKLGN